MADDKSNLPARTTPLDRAALERVLARAAELQHTGEEPLELISEQQLLEVGREVGLSPQNMRQALAEERTRSSVSPHGSADAGFFGPERVEARRVVQGTPSAVMHRLERFMDKEESLQIKRRQHERVVWEARRDFLGSVKRGFNVGGRGYALSSAFEVAATVVAVDDNSVLVQLTADYSVARRRAFTGAASAAGFTTVSALGLMGIAVTLGGSVVIAGAACAALAGAGGGAAVLVARSNRALVARGQLALDQALDTVERIEPQPQLNVLGTLLDAAVRDLRK